MGFWSWLTGGESAAKEQPKPREQPKAKPSSLYTLQCEKCGERYEIGADAAIFTWEQVMADFAAGGSRVSGAGGSTPDKVMRCDYQTVPAENRRNIERGNQLAISGRHSREWKCDKCKHVQKYE